jgi:hypothetical protein
MRMNEVSGLFLRSRANTIEGGTSRDHAQHPGRTCPRPARRRPRVDKDVAWKDVPRGG